MEYTPAEGELPDKLREMGFNVLGELPRLVVPEYNIDKKVQMTMPRKSKISKSVVYDIPFLQLMIEVLLYNAAWYELRNRFLLPIL